VNSISYLRTPAGYRHPDNTLIAVALGSGDRSKCAYLTQPYFKPYYFTGSSLSTITIPEAEDYQSNDAQAFCTWYKDASGHAYVYFSTDSTNPNIYYNAYYSWGAWAFSKSKNIGLGYVGGSVAVMDVINAAPSQPFTNPYDSGSYAMVMYIVNQSGGFGDCWGVLDVAFSNDGSSWIGPYHVNDPSYVYLEDGGVLWNGSNIIIFGVDGTFDNWADANLTSGNTYTYAYLLSNSDPTTATMPLGTTNVSNSGLVRPNADGYTNTNFLINCTFCFSSDYNYIYMTRAYAYPVDYSGTKLIPCGFGTSTTLGYCATGGATFPNRAQVYSMYIGGDPTLIMSGTWSTWNLLYDIGYEQGYRSCR